MTRRVLIAIAAVVGLSQVAFGQGYAPPAGGQRPAQAQPQMAQPQMNQQQTNQQPRQPASVYGPPQSPAAGQRPPAPQQQPPSGYAVRPTGGQQPIGGQPAGGQPGGPQPAGPQPGVQPQIPPSQLPPAQIAPAPQMPDWARNMNPAELQWLDQVLGFWEQRSGKIKTFSCKFQCWEYNAFGPPGKAQKFSDGVIKYAQPDKGLYRVENLSVYDPPPAGAPPPEKPKYVAQDKSLGEHWVCDGKQIFQFDAQSRRVIILPLPPGMQGQAIADGPLPFMFGAKAQTIKARYWVRGLPNNPQGKYLLEAVPKSREDARNFKMVHILLDQAEFLPDMLQIFEPNATPQNGFRKTYQFSERQTTEEGKFTLDFWKLFEREFYEPKIPGGWKKEVQGDIVNVIPAPAAGGQRPPQQAQQPAGPKTLPVPR